MKTLISAFLAALLACFPAATFSQNLAQPALTGNGSPVGIGDVADHAVVGVLIRCPALRRSLRFRFTGPAAPTAIYYSSLWQVSGSAAPLYSGAVATAFSTTQGASPTAAATNFQLILHIGLLNGANAGTIQLQMAASVSGTFTIQPGSWCTVQ